MFECVINVSEGRRRDVLASFDDAAGPSLRDRHSDELHHRSVFTLINEEDALQRDVRSLITRVMTTLDINHHTGLHPRLGVVDVVPFVALDDALSSRSLSLRDECARWIGESFDTPVFLYGSLPDGSERSLPMIRRLAFSSLVPDYGPDAPHSQRGACALGERPTLVAWNMLINTLSMEDAHRLAKTLRSPEVRVLAFAYGDEVQISCNLVDPLRVTPQDVYERLAELIAPVPIERCELVGLIPTALLDRVDPTRWAQLDIAPSRTIEARLQNGALA